MTGLLGPTLEIRCAQYAHDCRLPASIDASSRHIMLHIGTLCGAITMPVELGERVRDRVGSAPIIEHARARRWTFLTGHTGYGTTGSSPLSPADSAALFRLYVTTASTGSQVVLPSPEDEHTGYRTWVQPPDTGAVRPPLAAVIAATRAAGGPGTGESRTH
ncbi:hypothetical protein [Nocardia callitridis]|uniref:Uncharacterized protein n=1 Tax=Nocardia callitridis TaxID=648753 RepID=A0ABP9KC11_9NOCA